MCFEPIVPISTCNWLMGRNEFKVKMIKATCGYFVEIESDFETLSFYDFYINTMSNSKLGEQQTKIKIQLAYFK